MVRSWEDRFHLEKGFIEALREPVSKGLERFRRTSKTTPRSFPPPTPALIEGRAGFQPGCGSVQDGSFSIIGYTSTAFPLMLLIAALEDAQPGDRLLLAS